MQEREDLRKQLSAIRDSNWVDARVKKLARWPGKKREALRLLIEPSRRLYEEDRFFARIDQTVEYFEGLSARQRMKLWEGLFPKLAQHLERAWLDAGRRPYQFGYARFPFRAPSRSETTAHSRARYFVLVCEALRGLDPDASWLAAWGPHLTGDWRDPRVVGWLLSSVLRNGGDDADKVRCVLLESIAGDHEIGQMGQHIVVALLNSDERDDWETIGKLLLAAQRQEGLRQAILEAIDEAHPDAFRYMLGLIGEHDLGRFSATVRAFDVWLGMQWAGGSAKVVHDGVARLIEFFDDDNVRAAAIKGGEPEDAYLALWVTAYVDAESALALAAPMLNDAAPERRFLAIRLLERLQLFPETFHLVAGRLISGREDDDRLRMAMASFLASLRYESVSDELFDATARLFQALPPRKKKLDPIVWPWDRYDLDRRIVAGALKAMAQGAPEKLLPFAQALGNWDCVQVIRDLAGIGEVWEGGRTRARKRRKLTPEGRRLMIELTCDPRQDVQTAAFQAIDPIPVEQDEIDQLLANLHRSAAVLRQGAIGRLSRLADSRVLKLIDTLLADKHAKKRSAGLELASQLVESNRSADKARSIVSKHRDALNTPDLTDVADRLLGERHEAVSLDDCLGLVPQRSRHPTVKPRFVGVALETNASRMCLQQLAQLFLEHADAEVELPRGEFDEGGQTNALLAAAGWRFPTPRHDADPDAEAGAALPLADIWLDWLAKRGGETRDLDGLELVRAWAWTMRGGSYRAPLPAEFQRRQARDLTIGFERLVHWMAVLSPPTNAGALLTQYVEDSLAKTLMSAEEKKEHKEERGEEAPAARRFDVCHQLQHKLCKQFTSDDKARLGALAILALEQDRPGCEAGPSVENFVEAFDAGLVNDRDLVWLLLRPRKERERSAYAFGPSVRFGPIRELTRLRTHEALGDRQRLIAAVHQVRDRLVEIELTRGERLTPASIPAAELRHAGGADVLFQLALSLGRDKLVRQDEWGDPTRSYSFSRLISVTAPDVDDSPKRFTALFEASKLKPERLLELAMFAPQWASHVEHALGFGGLGEAVWWIHAHTKKNDYWRDREFRELWAAQINERTELGASDLEEGAVDVAWFRRIIAQIGTESWQRLQKPAKYASNSGGHKRAQLFADAMLGNVTAADLITRIGDKRHQDSVRAIGLVPLPVKAAEARAEVLDRYKRLQEFKRQSRKFGSQRQASEGRAVEIGMQNLARTAGYRDPRRLQWAMEAEAVADLAKGPVDVTRDETTVSLAIDDSGAPELSVLKGGKRLKSVPAKLRKHEPISQLRSRVTELRRQRSRMRLSLEESMCRGDEFSASELREFFAHPMLRPMMERLVLLGDGELAGYPEKDGRILRKHDGSVEPLGVRDTVRIAHSVDLLARGDWHAWQRDCFAAERIQPFKQVFREVYPKTNPELNKCDMTRRYAGHQVNTRQALSLLKQRQWVHSPEEGVRRVYHDEGIIAELWFQQNFNTPAEVEGLMLEGVAFICKADARKRMAMTDVPDRVFSEAMRDLDLVVSVAHSGGVDPEASASTVEMRATLLRETCQMLRLNNVHVEKNYALIDGSRASYSVHLGSATTMVTPGRVLLIVAVHSQYRGRLFLPFADADPKSAEVLAKALLLARDNEIQDPKILEQIV